MNHQIKFKPIRSNFIPRQHPWSWRRRAGISHAVTLTWFVAITCTQVASFAEPPPMPPETARVRVSQTNMSDIGQLLFSKPLEGTYLKRGTHQDRINYRQGEHIQPRLAPDGRRILWHSTQGGRIGIWLYNLDEKTSTRVCDGEHGAWSSNGDSILLARNGLIVERNLESGTEQVRSPANFLACAFPGYVTDDQISFVLQESPNDSLYLLDRNGHAQLLVQAEINSAPQAGPNGNFIAYQHGPHIWLVNLNTQHRRQLTVAAGIQNWPIWSLDGKSLAYCQGPQLGPWDIHHISIDAPRQIRQIQRDVWPGADWNGTGIPDSHIEDPQPDDPGQMSAAAATIQTAWITVAPHEQRGSIHVRAQGDDCSETSIIISGSDAHAVAWQIEDAPIAPIITPIHAEGAADDPPALSVQVSPHRPCIALQSSTTKQTFTISTNLQFIVVPDRFANDVIVSPDNHSTAILPLPWNPVVLGLMPGGQRAVMLITPSPNQHVTAIVDDGRCSGLRVDGANQTVYVCMLSAEQFWGQPSVTPDEQTSEPHLDWSIPFAGRWRVSLSGKSNHSLTITEKQAARLQPVSGFTSNVKTALIYLSGRSWNTPLDVFTPDDMLRDTLGIDAASRLLEIDQITGYRTTKDGVPLHQLLLPTGSRYRAGRVGSNIQGPWGLPWRRALSKGLDFSPILEFLGGGDYGGIVMSDSPGVRGAVDHLTADLVHLLVGLDQRREEYKNFVSQIATRCRLESEDNPDSDPLCEEILADIAKLESSTIETKITGIVQIEEQVKQLHPLLGTAEALGKTEQFVTFCQFILDTMSQRQEILKQYRLFLKNLSDHCGSLVVTNPSLKPFVNRLRQEAHRALGNRYYLEGDWRGEIPLSVPQQ